MSDEPTIQPALTADEWRDFLDPANKEWAFLAYHNLSNHAAAATGLYGQPFGFAQNDVDAIRQIARQLRREAERIDPNAYNDWGRRAQKEGTAAWWDGLADRIAALLPRTP